MCMNDMDMVLLERVRYTNTHIFEWNTSSHILKCLMGFDSQRFLIPLLSDRMGRSGDCGHGDDCQWLSQGMLTLERKMPFCRRGCDTRYKFAAGDSNYLLSFI